MIEHVAQVIAWRGPFYAIGLGLGIAAAAGILLTVVHLLAGRSDTLGGAVAGLAKSVIALAFIVAGMLFIELARSS